MFIHGSLPSIGKLYRAALDKSIIAYEGSAAPQTNRWQAWPLPRRRCTHEAKRGRAAAFYLCYLLFLLIIYKIVAAFNLLKFFEGSTGLGR